ncbi:hypothetical protein NQ314_021360 [Rhamnusium bicolor]|uniref:Farnesol dehydrogenase-like n=1 Tax=Rhamnusium bicolor TaxID=1586634 RepID=A0AAV8WIS9_9CUCU|nr:hypothetical protein NQ314_021360 [Rhamnusium bicolor]
MIRKHKNLNLRFLWVVGLARRKERIEELAEKLADKSGNLYAVKADMTNEDDILQAFEWIKENVGPVHILVNNAGLGCKTTIINGDISSWKKVLDTNVLGLAIASREAVKIMQENNIHGHIVNINSIAGHIVPPLPFQNVYPASKYAVTGFTETLRREFVAIGSKIKPTDFLESEDVRKLIESSPSLKSEDVANAVVYVLGTPPHVQVAELTIKPVGEFV